MKRCVIHCGMPKTGSSSVQHTLRFTPPGALPFEYVYVDKPNLTDLVGAVWQANPALFHTNRKLGLTHAQASRKRDRLRQLLAERIKQIEGDGLISAEGFCFLPLSGLREFHDWLLSFVDLAQVVGYVRQPKSFMESAFQQALRGGHISGLRIERLYPQYRKRLEKFDLVFGRKNVQFWKFDPENFVGGDVVKDFCFRLGFVIGSEHIRFRNEGLSLPAIRLLFAYRKFGPGYGVGRRVIAENYQLTKLLSQLRGKKLRFDPEIVEPVLNMYRSDTEWMESRLGVSLQENLVDATDTIRSESDLLKFEDDSLRWLAEQLGPSHVHRLRSNMTPQQIASWMHELRLKLAVAGSEKRQAFRMSENLGPEEVTLQELIRLAKDAVPKLKKMSDERATQLVREVLRTISARIASTREGEVTVAGLGKFRVNQVNRVSTEKRSFFKQFVRKVKSEQNGKKKLVKRVVFSPKDA